MRRTIFPWRDEFEFVEPGINADGLRVYPFDCSFPIDVSFLIADGRNHVRMNRHDFFEVTHLYHGTADIRVSDRHLKLQKGDIFVIGSNLYHQFLTPAGHKVRLVSLNFHPDVIRSNDSRGEAERYLAPFLGQGERFAHLIPAADRLSRDIFEWMLKIHNELPADTILKQLAVKTYLRMLLFVLLRHYFNDLSTRERVDRKEHDLQRLRPLFDLVEANYGQQIEVGDAARVCAMSSSHFMKFFKSTAGQSFRAYLTAFRIAKAQALLTGTNRSIAEVSEEVGFCSQSYFGEVFHAALGLTPLAYRRQFGGPQ